MMRHSTKEMMVESKERSSHIYDEHVEMRMTQGLNTTACGERHTKESDPSYLQHGDQDG